MLTSDFDYHLPPELIAQAPAPERDGSRLLVVERSSGRIEHRSFRDLPDYLRSGDLLVVNDTRVFPARLHGVRAATGGKVEALFLREEAPGRWLALTRSGGAMQPGEELVLAGRKLRVRLVERRGAAGDVLELPAGTDLFSFLEQHGEIPLPPYIARQSPEAASADRERYQTVFAREPGAVAAPTAGLHFTPETFAQLASRGVARTELTLHVGPGTFQPVKADRIEEHRLLAEHYTIGDAAAAAVNAAQASGRRVVAVGTTATRALEGSAASTGSVAAGSGWTEIFIHPPYNFKVVDALITNFHLPRSTLLMLVSAFAGRELVLEAYRRAVEAKYRFYSYGDCCLFI